MAARRSPSSFPRRAALACAAAAVLAGRPAAAQMQEPDRIWTRYTRQDHRIPMRDGVRLFTTVYQPKDTTRRYPVLLTRTPYGTDTYLGSIGPDEAFEREGYVFVIQDVRGRYQSEGEFVNTRPHRPARTGAEPDEASDTYDTIEWLLANLRHHNGRVGQWGISYLGFYATHGILSGHPALVAVSPQAPVTDWFVGDDFHHNGAFFLADAFDFLSSFGRPRPAPTRQREPRWDKGTPDSYDFFLRLGPIRTIDEQLFRGGIPFWTEVMQHGTYDEFWRARSPLPHLRDVRPAVLTVGSWFDAENVWGATQLYRTIERQSPGARNALVMGPWYHGQWWFDDGSALGDLRWGAPTTRFYVDSILLPFFNHHLKGAGPAPAVEAWVFETGANRWRSFPAWPPAGTAPRSLYFQPGGGLAMAPAPGQGADAYRSDPARPVPFIDKIVPGRPGSHPEYMVWDQRFASRRPDVVSYTTAPLAEPLTIAGPVEVSLLVSTTGTDADFVVKVIDVWPDRTPDPSPNPTGVRLGGYQQLLRGDVMRGKFRESLERPVPFVPGQPTRVRFTMPDLLHTFRPGHRVMIQVQSSWFPLVDRNPQTFVDIYAATAADFQPATVRIHWGGAAGSEVRVGVVPR